MSLATFSVDKMLPRWSRVGLSRRPDGATLALEANLVAFVKFFVLSHQTNSVKTGVKFRYTVDMALPSQGRAHRLENRFLEEILEKA